MNRAGGSLAGVMMGLSSSQNKECGNIYALEGVQLRGMIMQDQQVKSDLAVLQVLLEL